MKLTTTTRYGLKMFLAIGIFFMCVYLAGYTHISELRLLNILIVLYFSNQLVKTNYIEKEDCGYIENISSLFLANLINVLLCVIGFSIFIIAIDSSYLEVLQNGILWMQAETLSQMMFVLLIEGLSSAVIISFGMMQYWKNYKRVHKKVYATEVK